MTFLLGRDGVAPNRFVRDARSNRSFYLYFYLFRHGDPEKADATEREENYSRPVCDASLKGEAREREEPEKFVYGKKKEKKEKRRGEKRGRIAVTLLLSFLRVSPLVTGGGGRYMGRGRSRRDRENTSVPRRAAASRIDCAKK